MCEKINEEFYLFQGKLMKKIQNFVLTKKFKKIKNIETICEV